MMIDYSPPKIASSTSPTNWREAGKFLSAFLIVFFLTLFASEKAQALTSVNQAGAIAQKPPSVILVQKDTTLIVGSEQDFPPFATGMTDATAGGFTVELWKAVAAEAGLNYSIRVLPFRQVLKEFKKGKIDVLINLAVSDERDQFADFTVPHVIVQGAIFVREGASNIRSEEDLDGKSIIVLNGDLAHDYAVSKGWEKQLVLVDTSAEGMRLLASGKHDAMLLSKLTGMQTLKGLGLTSIEALKVKPGFSQKFAFAVPKGQSDLLSKINEGLALTKSNGMYNALYDKWFGVYEDNQVGLRDLLKFIIPIVVVFLGILAYFFYQRQVERKAALDTLKDRENHLRLSQMDGGIGTWEADLLTNRQTWSDNCYTLLGLPELSEPTWKDFLAIVHPEDRQRVIDATTSHLEHGTNYEVEYRTTLPNGEICWMRSAGQVQRDIDGKPIRMRGIVQNITERKLAEDKLKENEHKLSVILESVEASIYLKDIQGRYLFANRPLRELLGASMEEIVGQRDERFFAAETIIQLRNNDRLVLEEGRTIKTEETNINLKDGKISTYLSTKLPLRNEAGEIYALCGISTDITERKQAEERLRVSELALKAISQGVIISSADKRIRWVNNAFESITGYSNAEILGKTCRFLQGPLTDPSTVKTMSFALGNVMEFSGEVLNYRKDGTIFWNELMISPVRNEQGQLTHFIGVSRDITERMEAQKALTRQLELLQKAEQTLRIANEEQHAIFDSATSGIVLIKDGIIQRCNRKLEDIFGYASGELEGKPVRLWYTDEIAYETDGRPVYKAITYGKFHRLEQQLIRKDGSLFWARLSGKALDYDDPAKGMVGVIDDITLEHEATEALLKGKAMAEEATHTKSEFLANMSHEIRTPMNGVLGMLDMLRETKMTPLQRDWVETAHTSAEALLEIINDILDLTKLEAGKFEVEQVDFNLVELVEDICALLAGKAHKKRLELNCLLPVPMTLRWQGDPMRIRQVLTNLIGNALKFTGQGEVSVSVNWSSLTDKQNGLRFEVHDTGIGISAEAQLQLFQPFSQADSATSRRFGGSGLGLFISKKLVELMGGAIGMDSVPGKGSCFWFTLPLMQSKCQGNLAEQYDLTGKRALIVDDNATNRNILNNYLSRWGLEVNEVADGSAALMTLQASAIQGVIYDLILLDMQMPIMDGSTLAKCLVQIPALAKIPIILLSSSDQFDLVDYQSTEILQCLMKPVRQLQLFDAIVNALQGVSEATMDPAEPETQLPGYNGKKVLVVEDNKINQKVIIAKLAKFDIVPDLAENGQAALDKLAQNAYDLIFMDCQMPVMDGYTATRELRLLEASKSLPHQTVIALTANALEGELEKCLEAGMDDYLRKPIVSGQLIDMLACRLGSQNTE